MRTYIFKVYVDGRLDEILEHLLCIGLEFSSITYIKNKRAYPFLIINRNIIYYSNDMEEFSNHHSKEMSVDEVLALERIPKIETFKPFDKVLVRDSFSDLWVATLFSNIESNKECEYRCISYRWKFCIPYKGNEHLLGTSDNPSPQKST